MRPVLLGAGALAALALIISMFVAGPEVVNSDPSGSALICFGDSLTAGTGAEAGEAYPDHLSRALRRPVINAGVPGDTTASALARLESDVLERDPKVVFITLGGNDLMGGVEAEDAFSRLRTIVGRIQDRGALVIVGGLRPPVHGRGYAAAYLQLCEEQGCVLVDDVLDDILGRRDLMADQIHPNGDGYRIMASRFADAAEPFL